MEYKKILEIILTEMQKAASEHNTCNHYIFRNTKPIDMKLFPTPVTDRILEEYIEYLQELLKEDLTVGKFLENPAFPGVSTLGVDAIPLWEKIHKDLKNSHATGSNQIDIEAYNGSGNAMMMVVPAGTEEDKKEIFILSYHRNTASMLAGKIVFAKIKGFPFVKKEMVEEIFPEITSITGDMLVLSPQIDAIIYDGNCFVFNAGNFCRIFKYEEIVNKELKKSENAIKNLKFISDRDSFWDMIQGKISLKREMLKAIECGRLTRFKRAKVKVIQKKIQERTELAHIRFDRHGRIIITEQSCKDVVGILSDRIHIDLIFGGLNGVEKDE